MRHMAMPSKGHRVATTIRLPYDDYRDAVARARARGWSLSQYIAYAVGRDLGKSRETAARHAPGLHDRMSTVADKLATKSWDR